MIRLGINGKLLRNTGTYEAPELDALMAFVEELAGHLKFKRLESVGALWVKTANEPIFAPDHIEQFRQFTSVLTVTYRLAR